MASRIGNQRKLECGCNRMEKLILYETSSYFYLVGTSNSEEKYQMLKIDRGVEKPESLSDILVLRSNYEFIHATVYFILLMQNFVLPRRRTIRVNTRSKR